MSARTFFWRLHRIMSDGAALVQLSEGKIGFYFREIATPPKISARRNLKFVA